MSWSNESYRHSLAAHGIRTRAIVNPVAGQEWYDRKKYGLGSRKGYRRFAGSGLEDIETQDVVDWVNDIVILANQVGEEEGLEYHLKIKAIYVVGSRVSGFYTYKSDIDVLIEFNDDVPQDGREIFRNKMDRMMYDAVDMTSHNLIWMVMDKGGSHVKVDIAKWGWEGPDEGTPYLKIWEAPS